MIGTTIGSYRVEAVLGSGGMGVVYRATHEVLGSTVAIKVLASNFARDPRVLERFRIEAAIQARLRHDNIVQVTDFLIQGDTCAIVMEYLDGLTLDAWTRQVRPDPAQAIDLFLPVLRAMEFAHRLGVVHRDIKPTNLMAIATETGTRLKVMDFGIAKILGTSGATRTGTRMGTLGYMAPEQFSSSKDIDHRADVYALGATLYEVLTGRAPYEGLEELEVVRAIALGERPTPAGTLNPALDPALVAVLERAMDPVLDRRLASVSAFREALEAIRAGAAVPKEAPAAQAVAVPQAPPVAPTRLEEEAPPNWEENWSPHQTASQPRQAVDPAMALLEISEEARSRRAKGWIAAGAVTGLFLLVAVIAAAGIGKPKATPDELRKAYAKLAELRRAANPSAPVDDPAVLINAQFAQKLQALQVAQAEALRAIDDEQEVAREAIPKARGRWDEQNVAEAHARLDEEFNAKKNATAQEFAPFFAQLNRNKADALKAAADAKAIADADAKAEGEREMRAYVDKGLKDRTTKAKVDCQLKASWISDFNRCK